MRPTPIWRRWAAFRTGLGYSQFSTGAWCPGAFYLVLAAAFGYMLHVRGVNRQKYSEACRPVLGKHTDGLAGRLIDLLAVFALLAGTATTFSVATPLMASVINALFGVQLNATVVTIVILVITCAIYTTFLLRGLHGHQPAGQGVHLSVLRHSGLCAAVHRLRQSTSSRTGLTSLGIMVGNFIPLATYTDPLRTSNFPQNWTIYYWAYWMVWCVAAPFFIGSISRGRTIQQTILGGYVFGVGSTIMSFIILGNYSMHLQVTGAMDFVASYLESGDPYGLIISIIETMPCAKLVMVVLLLTMIAFYATSFDSIALTASCYSYHRLGENEMPSKLIQLMWCILLILLPIALIFAESSMNSLQTVSIIAAFPIGIVMILIVWSFLKDGKVTIKARETEE